MLRSQWVCPKSHRWACSWTVSLWLCLLGSDVHSVAWESMLKQWFIFFWRAFSCEHQWAPCNDFALWSLRNLGTVEYFLPESEAVWSPMSSAELLLGSLWAMFWAESKWGENSHVFLWAADLLKLPAWKPSENTVPYLFTAFSCLALPSLLFYPLRFCVSPMISSCRQGGLCTSAPLTVPKLTYLLFLASTCCKVLANTNHVFSSVACLLFG